MRREWTLRSLSLGRVAFKAAAQALGVCLLFYHDKYSNIKVARFLVRGKIKRLIASSEYLIF